jgi:hypothetical protein
VSYYRGFLYGKSGCDENKERSSYRPKLVKKMEI